jgi:hypothetical protein
MMHEDEYRENVFKENSTIFPKPSFTRGDDAVIFLERLHATHYLTSSRDALLAANMPRIIETKPPLQIFFYDFSDIYHVQFNYFETFITELKENNVNYLFVNMTDQVLDETSRYSEQLNTATIQ